MRDGHARFRAATDHYIRAYAANSGYDIGAVCARYSRWERDTALVGHAEIDEDDGTGPESADLIQTPEPADTTRAR